MSIAQKIVRRVLLLDDSDRASTAPPAEATPSDSRRGRIAFSQDWLPFSDVRDGLVFLRDGSYAMVLSVDAVPMQSLSPDEQDAVLGRFTAFLHSLQFPVSLYVRSETLRMDEYSQDLADRAAKAPEGLAHLMSAQGRHAARLIGEQHLLARGYYLAIRYTPPAGRGLRGGAAADVGLAVRTLGERRQQVEAGLKALGVGYQALSDRDLVDLLARSVQGTADRPPVGVDLRTTADRLNAIAPSGVREEPNALLIGRRHTRTLRVVGWPREGSTGILDCLYRFPAEVMVSLHVQPMLVAETVHKLQMRIASLQTQAITAQARGKPPDPYAAQAMADAMALRDSFAAGERKPLLAQLLVTLWADDPDQLEALTRLCETELAARMFTVRATTLEQSESFFGTLPTGQPGPGGFRELDSLSFSVTFPFASADLTDKKGILWGRNLVTQSVVLVDPTLLPAAHQVMVAATRSGKSYALKNQATQYRMLDYQVIAIDPSPHEYRRWCRALGGEYVALGVGSDQHISPGGITLPADLEHPDEGDLRPVSSKVEYLRALIAVLFADTGEKLGARDRAAMEKVLYGVYKARGMTDDWGSIVDPQSLLVVNTGGVRFQPSPRPKPMPVLEEIIEALRRDENTRHIGEALEPFATGTLSAFAGPTNVDLGKDLVVFNVRALVEDNPSLAPAAYFILSDLIAQRLRADRRKKFVAIDEAHNLFRDAAMATFVERLYRQAGKLGGAVALITQTLADLTGSPDGLVPPPPGATSAGVCLSMSYVRLLMRQTTSAAARHCASVFGLAESEAEWLAGCGKGEGLLLVDRRHAQVRIEVPPELHRFITSDPDEIAAIEAEERRQAKAV